MLAQLRQLSKFLLPVLFLTSCNGTNAPKVFYHTELNCPTRGIILIRYASEQDIKNSLAETYRKKKETRSSENFTVISLPGKRSFKIEKTPVEEIMECSMRQVPAPKPNKKFLKNLFTPTYDFNSW
jgi:hypothetical protein